MSKIYNFKSWISGGILFAALCISFNVAAQVPVAKFGTPVTVIEQYESVQLFDSSTNNPYQWEWDLYDSTTYMGSGFYPRISSGEVTSDPWNTGNDEFSQNPVFSFDYPGKYTVVMRCRNASGWSGKVVKKKYIIVSLPTQYNLGYGMYGPKNDNVVESDYGSIFDDGGPNLHYSNSEGYSTRSYLHIRPCRANKIELVMTRLKFADTGDVLSVYDSDKEDNSKLLAAWTYGNTSNKTVTALSGDMFIVFKSNKSGVDSGFAGTYTSELDTGAYSPVIGFTADTPFYNSVPFRMSSSVQFPGVPEYEWTIDNNKIPNNNRSAFRFSFFSDGRFKICLKLTGCDMMEQKCDTVRVITPHSKTALNFKASATNVTQYDNVWLTPLTDKANRFEWTISPSSYQLLNAPKAPDSYSPGHIKYVMMPGDSFPLPHIQIMDSVCYTIKLKAYNSLDSAGTADSFTKANYVCGKSFKSIYGLYGNIFHDQNSNCQLSSGEPRLKGIPVKLYDTANNLVAQTYPLSDGTFLFDKTSGKYRIKLDLSHLPVESNCALGIDTLVTFSKSSPFGGVSFPLECKAGMDLGAEAAYTNGVVFPGQQHTLRVNAGLLNKWYGINCNQSTVSGSVKISVTGKVTYQGLPSGARTPSGISGKVFTYNISNFDNVNNGTDFGLNFLTDTSAQAGDTIKVSIEVLPLNNDYDTTNNRVSWAYRVRNSKDPNIKEAYPENVPEGYKSWITYTIHFQNSGDFSAFNIRLEDTLDNWLDPATFQVLEYSHSNLVMLKGNILKVYYDDIMLPDSASDPSGSIGFIQYRIKPRANMPAEARIKNTAYIYFDYNAPVVTNTAETRFYAPIDNISAISLSNAVKVFPNPGSGLYTITSQVPDARFELFSLSGMSVYHGALTGGEGRLDIHGYEAGIYFLKVYYGNLSYVVKLVKY